MTRTLALLHPFMPYITEEIWQTLPHTGDALMMAKYPAYDAALSFPQDAAKMESIMAAVRGVRNRRSEMNVEPSRKTVLYIATEKQDVFRAGEAIFKRLAYASGIQVAPSFDLEGAVTIVTSDAKVYIQMDELVDKKAERARLEKELATAQKGYQNAAAKLKNEKFMSKAPEKVVNGVRDNAQKLKERIALITSSLEALK
jgi:valyl-tRNA synthetase